MLIFRDIKNWNILVELFLVRSDCNVVRFFLFIVHAKSICAFCAVSISGLRRLLILGVVSPSGLRRLSIIGVVSASWLRRLSIFGVESLSGLRRLSIFGVVSTSGLSKILRSSMDLWSLSQIFARSDCGLVPATSLWRLGQSPSPVGSRSLRRRPMPHGSRTQIVGRPRRTPFHAGTRAVPLRSPLRLSLLSLCVRSPYSRSLTVQRNIMAR